MTALRRYNYSANAITQCVRGSIKIHRPSGSFLRSFIKSRFFAVGYQHDVLIWELEIHGLVVIQGLMRQMICQYTPLDFFLGYVLDVVLG